MLVTIKSFLTPSEADMMKSILSSEDIFCYLKDENSVITAPFLSNAIGGVKLQVREEDIERSIAILRNAGMIKEPIKKGNWFKEYKALIILSIFILALFLYFFIRTIPSLF